MTGMEDCVALRRAVDILDGMVQKMVAGERIEIPDAAAMLGVLRFLGDDGCSVLSAQGGLLDRVTGLEEALKKRWAKEFVRGWQQLSSTLKHHLTEKNSVGAPELQNDGIKLEIHTRLARLERKYASSQTSKAPWESQPAVAPPRKVFLSHRRTAAPANLSSPSVRRFLPDRSMERSSCRGP